MGILGQGWNREDRGMFSTEQRTKTIETFIKHDHSYADTTAELGYPTKSMLRI